MTEKQPAIICSNRGMVFYSIMDVSVERFFHHALPRVSDVELHIESQLEPNLGYVSGDSSIHHPLIEVSGIGMQDLTMGQRKQDVSHSKQSKKVSLFSVSCNITFIQIAGS